MSADRVGGVDDEAPKVRSLFQTALRPVPCGAGDGLVDDGVILTDGTVWHLGCTAAEMPSFSIRLPEQLTP